MSNRDSYKLAVIIADEFAARNLVDLFARLRPDRFPEVEFLVCSTSAATELAAIPQSVNVCVLPILSGTRIPLLWRDGILKANAPKVALTTAHCIPSSDWLERLLGYELNGDVVALGGAIENDEGEDAVGSAIHLLRYINYTGSRKNGVVSDIAADNAIYRRENILEYDALLKAGFWEPSFHQRFHRKGLILHFDNKLQVVHHNCYRPSQFLSQRFAHGVEFGEERAKRLSVMRQLLMVCLSPLIPLLFLSKILIAAFQNKDIKVPSWRCFFWLLIFVLGWSMGEVTGYLKGLNRKLKECIR